MTKTTCVELKIFRKIEK